jgi:eukaryotic-like serine/threonine-protein kinase
MKETPPPDQTMAMPAKAVEPKPEQPMVDETIALSAADVVLGVPNTDGSKGLSGETMAGSHGWGSDSIGSGTMPFPSAQPNIQDASSLDFLEGKYRVLGELGKGGMGQVFLAEHIALRREVAIKVMRSPEDEESIQRFLIEASSTASLEHPNTVRIYDFGRNENNLMYLVMELLKGKDLKDYIKDHGPMSPVESVRIGLQICGALSEAHRKNIVHRDLKPTNVYIVERPEMGLMGKLIDFGLVKNLAQSSEISSTGMIVGSPMFMAPEQITTCVVDDRTDVYSLGLTLYYTLSGKNPYKVKGLPAVLNAQLHTIPDPLLEISPALRSCEALVWLVETAIQKDPKDRFQSAQQMLEALQRIDASLTSGSRLSISFSDGALKFEEAGRVNTGATYSALVSNEDSEDLQTLHQTAMPSQPTSSSSSGILALVGAIMLLAAVVAYFQLSAPQPGPVVEEAVKVKEIQTYDILFDSIPSEAEVYRNGKEIGMTPLQMRLKDNETTELEIRLDGYETKTIVLDPSQPKPRIKLKKKAEAVLPAKKVQKRKTAAPEAKPQPKKKPTSKPKKNTTDQEVVDPWAD